MHIVETVEPRQFQLRPAFLESYYTKVDPFKTLLARSTYLNKYSRNRETWTDTVRRVVEGSLSLDPRTTEMEGEMLFHLFWTGQVLPPGRGLWTGGIPGIPADARFNCFAAETRFWANGTLVSFEEAAGQTVEVLAKDGQWRSAEVRSFGKQKLYRYLLKPPGRTNFAFEYVATAEHRWFTSNRGEVTDLRVGDRVTVTPNTVDDTCPAYIDGFAHGFVFGDGSKDALRQDIHRLRLCGEKDQQHAPKLKSASTFHNDCSPPSFDGDPLLFFKSPRNFKLLPSDDLGREYLSGFLAGWLAADGSLRASGRGGNRLAAQNAEALDWVVERAPLLGFCVTGRSFDPSTETNFGPRASRLEILTLQTDSVEYTVRAVVDEGREEEVFCVTEPITSSFTLAGGVVTGNCWYTTLNSLEDWCWAMERLMLGGGVGVGLNEIGKLPGVSATACKLAIWCRSDHPDIHDVVTNDKTFLNGSTPIYRVLDSREGWVEAERRVLRAAYEGTDLIVDVSDVRQRGSAIKTFGGVACGPGPLTHLLRSSHEIIRGAAGRKLTSVECLDITNFVGFCVKSGNVRRSALITLGDAEDREFRDAKKDWDKVASHRHTSNNSIVFRSWSQIENFDWFSLVEDMTENGMGEPGLLNLPLVWRTDPAAKGVNPCGEQAMHDREACNLAEVFPAQFEPGTDIHTALQLTVRYCLRQRLTPLLDPQSHAVGMKNMRVGVGLGGLCDFDWTPYQLGDWWGTCRREANDYADALGVNRPLTTTTIKPSGTISLLNGSSPGIHAPWDEYILRRVRVAANDPMAYALMDAGVPFEYDSYDNTDKTLVFAFPHKAPLARATVQSQTVREQFERQALVQEWWADNAVSATISFKDSEKAELPHLLKEFVPRLKSTTCLPSAHGYKQAPLESIDEDTYRNLHGQINHGHPLARGGDFEVEECVSGVCPVR